jgi:hypothetical protein
MALLSKMAQDVQELRNELSDEAKLREQLVLEFKEESARHETNLEEMTKERSAVEAEIITSIRQVLEQGTAFRDAVCKEAAEQRTIYAQELRSSIEAACDQRVADLHATVEMTATLLHQRCDAQEQFSKSTMEERVARLATFVEEVSAEASTQQRMLATLSQRCDALEENSKASVNGIVELRDSIRAEHAAASQQRVAVANDLQAVIQEKAVAMRSTVDDIGKRFAGMEQTMNSVEFKQFQESLASVIQDLKEEEKERGLLSSRLRSETDQRSKVISAVWLEVANVQQQVGELRGNLRQDDKQEAQRVDSIEKQLINLKQTSEERHTALLSSLEAWQTKLSASFEKHKSDVSELRDHMTDHMSWVAVAHESAVSQLKQQVSSNAEQIGEVTSQLTQMQMSERDTQGDTSARRSAVVISRSDSAGRSGSTGPVRRRPLSPMPGRSLPQPPPVSAQIGTCTPPVVTTSLLQAQQDPTASPMRLPLHTTSVKPTVSCSTTAGTSLATSAGSSAGIPTPTLSSVPSRNNLQRATSTGLLSARFSGPARSFK